MIQHETKPGPTDARRYFRRAAGDVGAAIARGQWRRDFGTGAQKQADELGASPTPLRHTPLRDVVNVQSEGLSGAAVDVTSVQPACSACSPTSRTRLCREGLRLEGNAAGRAFRRSSAGTGRRGLAGAGSAPALSPWCACSGASRRPSPAVPGRWASSRFLRLTIFQPDPGRKQCLGGGRAARSVSSVPMWRYGSPAATAALEAGQNSADAVTWCVASSRGHLSAYADPRRRLQPVFTSSAIYAQQSQEALRSTSGPSMPDGVVSLMPVARRRINSRRSGRSSQVLLGLVLVEDAPVH